VMSFNRSILDQLAASRLEHVRIALRDGDRAYNIRDVLDPWWCFKRGQPFVTQRRDKGYADIQFNKPCAWDWREVLHQFDGISEGAARISALGQAAQIVDRKNHPKELSLVVDHSVPLSVICKHLWMSPHSWTVERLAHFLRGTFRRAVISYTEDDLLKSRKLSSRMPDGWQCGDDPFARYREVGIRGSFVSQ
jgi:hypothetical protein